MTAEDPDHDTPHPESLRYSSDLSSDQERGTTTTATAAPSSAAIMAGPSTPPALNSSSQPSPTSNFKSKSKSKFKSNPKSQPSTLIRTLTSLSTQGDQPDRSPDLDPLSPSLSPPPPDGGRTAWTQALCLHLTIFSTFGYLSSFGVFQTHYEGTLGVAPSTISWIGSTQFFLVFFVGTFSGRALDAGLFRPVYVAGAVLQVLGIFATAECHRFWQLFLAQALCSGVANGLQFCPAMGLLTTYFDRRRAWAVGLAQLGSCTGGVVFPVVVQQLLPRLGFAWTVRVIGFIMVATNAVTIALYRTRLPPRKTGPLVEWAAFGEAPYSLYCAALFFTFWGLYFTFFYVGSYGRTVLGISYSQSINVLLTVVCAGFVFRLLPNYFADRLGALNSLIPFVFLCGIMMFAWIGVDSVAGLFVFAAVYGSGSAGLQSLYAAVFHPLSKDPDLKKSGVRMGMTFSLISFAVLTGAPLGGALIQLRDGDYLYAQIWGGLSFMVGGSLLIAARFAKVGWDWRARI